MSDPTPPPTPTPTPTPKRVRRNSALLNQAQVRALTKAEQICLAVQKSGYAAKLAPREISPKFVQQLVADIAAARVESSSATQKTSTKETATIDETQARAALLAGLQEIQAAAKQKYGRREKVALKGYGIGERLRGSRAALEQLSRAILDKAAQDELPGITDKKIGAVEDLRTAYVNANVTQSSAQSAATSTRSARDGLVDSITRRRLQIQHAADAEWPYNRDINAGTRAEFYIPATRPFNG